MELTGTFVLVAAMVAGVVELIKRLFDGDLRAAAIIAASAITGAVCGITGVEGIDIPTGIVVGFAASGIVTIAAKVNSTRTE